MDIWKFIQRELMAGEKVMLLVVTEIKGSTPGKPGFKMAVSGNGAMAGSVGGGVMEYNMVNLSRDLLQLQEVAPLAVRQVHDPDAKEDRSGLLCSGLQINILFPLERVHLEVIDAIADAVKNGKTGTLDIQPDLFRFKVHPIEENKVIWDMESENQWVYSEAMGLKPVFYIFGGGHLSVPLSQVLRMLDFRVVIYDDRDNLNTMTGNVYANVMQLVDYKQAEELLEEGDHVYVAIMTVSHANDQMILGKLLQKRLKYLGMIGSKKKVEKIFGALRSAGATDEQLSRVDSPMGIDIGSQTVEEIAVSIAARVIQKKNAKRS